MAKGTRSIYLLIFLCLLLQSPIASLKAIQKIWTGVYVSHTVFFKRFTFIIQDTLTNLLSNYELFLLGFPFPKKKIINIHKLICILVNWLIIIVVLDFSEEIRPRHTRSIVTQIFSSSQSRNINLRKYSYFILKLRVLCGPQWHLLEIIKELNK